MICVRIKKLSTWISLYVKMKSILYTIHFRIIQTYRVNKKMRTKIYKVYYLRDFCCFMRTLFSYLKFDFALTVLDLNFLATLYVFDRCLKHIFNLQVFSCKIKVFVGRISHRKSMRKDYNLMLKLINVY
jgi:hypothetical protein